MAGRVRGFETTGDMFRSLAVVGAFVGVILLITLRQTPDAVKRVDTAPVTAAVAQAAPFDALVPGPEPRGWTPTSARVTPASTRPFTWFVGYQTDDDQFVSTSQVYGSPTEHLEAIGAVGTPDGTSRVGTQTWNRLVAADGSRRTVLRTDGEVTTIVTGSADYAVLERTAGALRPAGS